MFFPLPEPLITGEATRVMSLRDGTKKMSKSDPSDHSRINLTDDAETIAQKFRRAKTDPEPLPSEEKGLASGPKPTTWSAFMLRLPTPHAPMFSRNSAMRSSRLQVCADRLAVAKLAPIGAEMKRLLNDPAAIDAVLKDGAARARKIPVKR